MTHPTAAMLVIGDEILSGRTRDSNLYYLAQELTRIGIRLDEARIVADRHDDIVAAIRSLSPRHTHVFTSGGIGPTQDDITADAVAAALNAPISHRADAMALLQAHCDRAGLPFNEARQRMARIPEGARLIDNPISTAPGFTLGNVHVMAGVPDIFQAMLASLLPGLTGGPPLLSQSLRVMRGEGEIATAFGALAADYPDLSMGSYPFNHQGAHGTNLVIRGSDPARLDEAMVRLTRLFG
ncbi:MAG TPA: molybdopterin-binding protein [Tabrizicola sp.]|nr:molybdopterin-binding protein [Tabrizicola sp.]